MDAISISMFPFADPESAANAQKALTPGTKGNYIITADQPGRGKSTLAEMIFRAQGYDRPDCHKQPSTWRGLCILFWRIATQDHGYLWVDDLSPLLCAGQELVMVVACGSLSVAQSRSWELVEVPPLVIITGNCLDEMPHLERHFTIIRLGEARG